MSMPSPPLFGLILSGGRSRRMTFDKALLRVSGESLLARTEALLPMHVEKTVHSIRAGQKERDFLRGEVVCDSFSGFGPMGAILSAQLRYPDVAFLVVACDMPMLTSQTINHLVNRRNPKKLVTCYLSETDQLPEPLCAIYEPRSWVELIDRIANDQCRLRPFLQQTDVQFLQPIESNALFNMNKPSDFHWVRNQLEMRD